MRSLLANLRRNAIAYTALVVALVGMPSAYAVATIRSADIVDGEVKAVDLGANAVRSTKILDGEVQAADLGANAVRSPKILDRSIANADLAPDAITGDKVADGTLTGLDVYESTLGTVPSALQAGLGRADPTGSCDPESYTFVACSTASITLNQPARLFVIGTVRGYAENNAGEFNGNCRLSTSVGGAIESSRDIVDGDESFDDFYDNLTMHTITAVLPAGTVYVGIECNEDSPGAIKFDLARVSVIGLSAG